MKTDPIASKSTQVQGRKIFYREAGQHPEPAVLLLLGFPTSSYIIRSLIPEFSGQQVVAPDLPAFGFSDAPELEGFDNSGTIHRQHELIRAIKAEPNVQELWDALEQTKDDLDPYWRRAKPLRKYSPTRQHCRSASDQGAADGARSNLITHYLEQRRR